MKVLIVLPVYNEEKILRRSVISVMHFLDMHSLAGASCTILLSDNGSTDATECIGRQLAAENHQVIYLRTKEKGKGLAIRNGWSVGEYDVYIYMDADLAYDLSVLPRMVKKLKNGCDLVVSSRLLPGSISRRPRVRKFLTRGYNFLLRVLFVKRFTDAQSGCKAVTRKVRDALLPHINEDGLFFDTLLLIRAERQGYRICDIETVCEDPRAWRLNIVSTVFHFLRKTFVLRMVLWLE